jgi:small subunit ribosomal protein S3
MGQKVNPKGLRLGILYPWESRWMFSKKTVYRTNLLQDIDMRKKIISMYEYAVVTRVEIERSINKVLLIIHAVKPGIIIGKGGKGLEDLKAMVEKIIRAGKNSKEQLKIELKIEQIKKPYLNAHYVASDIARKLIRRLPHRRVVHHAMERVMEAGAKGVKIQLAGRIGGASISRKEKYFEGSVPTSTIREDVDFSRIPSLTKSGYIGVKVWIARK